jgi:serine/threonine protein kinase
MPAKVTLTIIAGSLKGQKVEFDSRTTCIIGRHYDCKPQLPSDVAHSIVSRYHCLLDINPPQIRIRDLGSKNGTFVNSNKIGQRPSNSTPEEARQMQFPECDLQDGDEIRLGNTVFRVSIEVVGEPDIGSEKTAVAIAPPAGGLKPSLQTSHLPTIEGYTTLKELGRGGRGAVYLARNNQTGEEIALKLMLPQVATNPRDVAWFLREVENTKALNHPHVIGLKESGYCDGIFYFTLEYCAGGNVIDLMRQRGGKLPVSEAVPIILQVLDGLAYAHTADIPYVKLKDGSFGWGQGLVHRDLKPDNIFLSTAGNSIIAKIGDYGLAKAFDLAGFSNLTMSGTKAGTPGFMPRQQVLNFKYVKPEVDIWAAAATLYYMLTGTYPRDFAGKDPFLAVLDDKPVPVRVRDASIPQNLAEVIDLALIDSPAIYFKNAADFKQALSSAL